MQHVVPNNVAISWVEMLRALGRGLNCSFYKLHTFFGNSSIFLSQSLTVRQPFSFRCSCSRRKGRERKGEKVGNMRAEFGPVLT